MGIPGWGTIKEIGLAILFGALAFLGIAWGKEKDRRKAVEDALETTQKATDELVSGLEKESEIQQNTDIDRDHFDR